MPTTDPSPRTPVAAGDATPHRYGHGKRLFYGLLWLAWCAVGLIGGFSLLGQGEVGGGLVGLAFGAVAALYDYRIWTWQARRLWFLIII